MLNDGDMYLTLTSKVRIFVLVVREVTLILDDSCLLELKGCLYVTKFRKNLISVSSLCKLNYSFFLIINKFLLNFMICLYAQDH